MSEEQECSMGTKEEVEGKRGSQQLEWKRLVEFLIPFYRGM